MIILGIIFFILALGLLYLAYDINRIVKKKQEQTGVAGDVLYSDTDATEKPQMLQTEIDSVILQGKPDYIIKKQGQVIPLEYKSGKSPKFLYNTYKMQVGAYFKLIEDNYKVKPEYGILRFIDGKEFKIENSEKLRRELLRLIDKIKAANNGKFKLRRGHNSANKCISCEYSPICEESLAKKN